eukprot:CAMPEP_0113546530 /NCGR_PEP_ID=MMETSP0015_2-20120614/11852_1 /TAXON_ID=2838 /ORGANISM="Odontella" /LENGTH=235 /DNA_ID=CAMNT_0000446985 /DNA_START=185 /DNA_END=892 /DNA_ORIENTATION=- /assembly_acc=CAM_ASM_000160
MEVASPLPFPHGQSGSKRRFAFSPGLDTTAIGVDSTQDLNMDDASTCHQPLFKRRRRQSHESNVAAGSSSGISAFPTFASPAFAALGTPQTKSGGYHTKRSRTEASDGGNVGIRSPSPAQQKIIADLQRLVDHQATEIERLKAEKNAVESAASELKSSHDKAVNENRILKKAVTIQQERQKQASSEIESARGFRAEAEDRIRKLEQMNLTLRYHLQAQQPAIGNDFMGSRPPDVY